MSGKGGGPPWMVVCHTLTTWKRGKDRLSEGRAEVRPSLLLVGGEVVAMVSRPRTG